MPVADWVQAVPEVRQPEDGEAAEVTDSATVMSNVPRDEICHSVIPDETLEALSFCVGIAAVVIFVCAGVLIGRWWWFGL